MNIRNQPIQDSISIRMNKDEWKKFKEKGDSLFNNRNVAYISVGKGRIVFHKLSPLFKDFKELDEANKECDVQQEKINKKVAKEIVNKQR